MAVSMYWLDVLFIAVLMILAMALVVRYIYWSVDQDGQRLARLESDPAFRKEELSALDQEIARYPEDPRLRRRRADVRRFDINFSGVAQDLEVYLKAVPADDTGWSEFSEALLQLGPDRAEDALTAIETAIRLDPDYIDHHAMRVRACLGLGRISVAKEAVDQWQALAESVSEKPRARAPRGMQWGPIQHAKDDPWLAVYQTAVLLAEGETGTAKTKAEALCNMGVRFTEEDFSSRPELAPAVPFFAEAGLIGSLEST